MSSAHSVPDRIKLPYQTKMGMKLSKKSDKHKRPKEGKKTTRPPELLRKRIPGRTQREFSLDSIECREDMGRNQGGEKPFIDDFPPVNNPGVIVPAGVRALGAEVPPPAEPRA